MTDLPALRPTVSKPLVRKLGSQKPRPTKPAQSIHRSAVTPSRVPSERSAVDKWSSGEQVKPGQIQANRPNDENSIPINLEPLLKASGHSRMTERNLRSKAGTSSKHKRIMRSSEVSSEKMLRGRSTRQDPISCNAGIQTSRAAQSASAAAFARTEARDTGDMQIGHDQGIATKSMRPRPAWEAETSNNPIGARHQNKAHVSEYNSAGDAHDFSYRSHTKGTTDRQMLGRDVGRLSTRERSYRIREPEPHSDVSSSNSGCGHYSIEDSNDSGNGRKQDLSDRNDSSVAFPNRDKSYTGKDKSVKHGKHSGSGKRSNTLLTHESGSKSECVQS